jgi:hypothetical protein
MASVAERLLKLKDEIDRAKLDKASEEGALKQNLQRIKDEFQCRSIEAAKLKLEKLKDEKAEISIQIENALTKLESSYQW